MRGGAMEQEWAEGGAGMVALWEECLRLKVATTVSCIHQAYQSQDSASDPGFNHSKTIPTKLIN